ncbi:MAG: methyltransferase domain-containing protein [bacterium]
MFRVNLGCGRTPAKGWRNFDNSYSVRLRSIPLLPGLLLNTGILLRDQYDYLQFTRVHDIEYGDILKGLPLADSSVEVLYSSHVLEHLDRQEVEAYLREARRILCPGGILRLVVPDLAMIINKYNENHDADAFVTEIYLSQLRPRTFTQRLRATVVGSRIHQWVYDGASLSAVLMKNGFIDPTVLKPGETTIPDPGEFNLSERADVSLYVEARKG